jgi:putative FmdB family regulatory protein
MPIYEYRCTNEHRFEVLQRITDDPITACQECGAPATRVLHPVAIHFKGSGFYSTDYGRGKKAERGESSSDGKSGGDSKSSTQSSSEGSAKSEPKKAAEG